MDVPNSTKWKRELAAFFGREKGAARLARITETYNKLRGQAREMENKTLRRYFQNNILPVVAAYRALLADGVDQESALRLIDRFLEAAIETERRIYRFWGAFPFFFDMLKLTFKPMMERQFPERWEMEWLNLGPDVIALNCRACFYLDVLREYGCAELAPHICRLDDLLAAEVLPRIRFERTQTLGRGGNMCDFRYIRACLKGEKE